VYNSAHRFSKEVFDEFSGFRIACDGDRSRSFVRAAASRGWPSAGGREDLESAPYTGR
jgi:hypothetical protein